MLRHPFVQTRGAGQLTVNPSVNSGLWLITMYHYGLIPHSEYSALMQGLMGGGTGERWSTGALYVTHNFSVNLEMLPKQSQGPGFELSLQAPGCSRQPTQTLHQ